MPQIIIPIQYAVVCYKETILASCYYYTSNDYASSIHSVLRSLNFVGRRLLKFPADGFQVLILQENEFVYACVTDISSEIRVPFTFLTTIRDKFLDNPSLFRSADGAIENEFNEDFKEVISQTLYEYNTGRGDKISKVQTELNDVKVVMLANIEKVIERGEKLDDLLERTEELERCGTSFLQEARKLRVQKMWKHFKMWLLIGSLLTSVLTIAILLACGVIRV